MKTTSTLLISFALVACQAEQIPSNAILSVSPSTKSFEITSADPNAPCTYSNDLYQDVPLLFTLMTAEGSPIGDADLTVISDFTSTTFNGIPVIGLYDDANGNGVVDGPSELVSGSLNEGFTTKTSKYGGERLLWARVYLACPFSAELFAYSGPVSTSARISVVLRGENEPEQPETDDSPGLESSGML